MNTSILNLFDMADSFLNDFAITAPSKLPDVYVSSRFPPCDILKTKDNSLVYKMALAGYSLSEIDIKFDDNKMYLTVDPKEVEEEEEGIQYRQHGIKRAYCTTKFFVPIAQYDIENAKATFKDGILTIKISSKEVAKPKSVKIDII